MRIHDILLHLETFAPLSYQESYDNSGLLVGDRNREATGALLCLDMTEEVLDEAIAMNCNLIIAHHPVIFSGLKRITGSSFVERVVIKAIKHDIALYACHTNADNVQAGVNKKIADKLGLKNQHILSPKNGVLQKLETFVPAEQAGQVRQALFAAGAGNIGNYSECSFSMEGTGSFKGNEASNPVVGTKGITEHAKEIKLEVIFEKHLQGAVLKALKQSHPYEEVAYYLHNLDNYLQTTGSGRIGELEQEEDLFLFLEKVKMAFKVPVIKHTAPVHKKVRRIALCGGAGSFLLKDAIRAGADLFLTADFKYHEFFNAENKLVICDIGHYETEQFTPEIFSAVISKKFPTFALHLSKVNTNPINYF